MNKKTLSRIAAFSLACAAVVPTFGVVASADVTIKQNILDNTTELTGTATLMHWAVTYKTTTHTASYIADTTSVSFTSNTTLLATDAAGNLPYNDNGGVVTAVNRDGVYYATAANANLVNSNLNKAVVYVNKNGNGDNKGSDALTAWKRAWTNYSYNERQLKAMTTSGAASFTGYADAAATTLTTGLTTNDISAPASTFEQLTYTLTSQANNNVTMAELQAKFGEKVDIDDVTGVIDTGNDYTIIISTSTGSTSSTVTSATYSTPSSSYRTSSSYVYYSNLTHMYYPNLSALQSVEGVHSNYVKSVPSISYSSTNCYFDALNGTYRSYLYDSYSYKVNNNENSVYKVNGYYYATYSDAYSAANGNTSKIDFVRTYSTTYDYFSNVTGSFYSTYYAALSASNGDSSKVDVFNGASTYDYYDPYYYYYLNYGNYSTTTKDTTSATMGKKSGWTAIAKSLKSTSAGSTVTVTMNDEETIPSTVLSAIKGRNVTVKFTLDNGVVYTVNGKDVTTAKDVDINTTYNTKNVPSKLAKAAVKKNDGVSSAQISIDSSSLGFTSDVTIKLPSKRAGYSAKLYRYNSSRNSLVLVDTATIKTNGKCTFENVTKGGDYVVVVY